MKGRLAPFCVPEALKSSGFCTGIEPAPKSEENYTYSDTRGPESGAIGTESYPIDPRLASILNAWAELPEATKTSITAMAMAACKRSAKRQ